MSDPLQQPTLLHTQTQETSNSENTTPQTQTQTQTTTPSTPTNSSADPNSLEFNVKIHEDDDSDNEVHHRRHLYKGRGEQIERREKFLRLQKEKKRDLTKHARNLALPKDEPQSPSKPVEDEILTLKDESMSEASSKGAAKQKERKRKQPQEKKIYVDQLMMPEPLRDMPTDNSEWIAVPSPPGQRCLVISSRKSTQVRLSNGTLINKFYSLLPNGSKNDRAKINEYCILDCIFYEPSFTFFVLDIMCWKGYSLYDCTTDFRFYWKITKLQEVPGIELKSDENPYKFISLPYHDCNIESLGEIQTSTANLGFERVAVVLYNKNTQYTMGYTPLVCVISREQEQSFLEALQKGEMSMS
eukprot:TRINITY_DN5372_c0_g1_i2.p1 TRINITY_DN5372_c0_g1~~TRINITY_DN5372_c0_g1_i2.p1  ORF type:complete len:389 (+),score=82.81 TRINITY_DN5372_c0_g1_i2:99-1169(+)